MNVFAFFEMMPRVSARGARPFFGVAAALRARRTSLLCHGFARGVLSLLRVCIGVARHAVLRTASSTRSGEPSRQVALSLPLILLAFAAAGVAVAMLTADLLARLDVSQQVDAVLEKEVLPLVDGSRARAETQTFVPCLPDALERRRARRAGPDRRVDMPWRCGDAAAATWMFRGDESR